MERNGRHLICHLSLTKVAIPCPNSYRLMTSTDSITSLAIKYFIFSTALVGELFPLFPIHLFYFCIWSPHVVSVHRIHHFHASPFYSSRAMHADRVVLGFKRWAVESFVPPLCKLGMYSMTLETPPKLFIHPLSM